MDSRKQMEWKITQLREWKKGLSIGEALMYLMLYVEALKMQIQMDLLPQATGWKK